MFIYYVTYFFTKLVLSSLFFPRRCYGQEHIPAQGGFILASNHVSNLDPVVLGVSSVRKLNFMAKAELFEKQPLGFFLTQLAAFPVRREMADLGALKEGLKRLRKGEPVLIFVEGRRRRQGETIQAQPGVGFLAAKAGVPVIPVFVNGTQKVMPPGASFFKRNWVSVHFGPPIKLDLNKAYENIAQDILVAINDCQPSK